MAEKPVTTPSSCTDIDSNLSCPIRSGGAMAFDPDHVKNAKKETKAELRSWRKHFKPSSAQHLTATVELLRRSDRTDQIRFWVVFIVIALALMFGTVAVIRYLW
jgi:hypothetical protein